MYTRQLKITFKFLAALLIAALLPVRALSAPGLPLPPGVLKGDTVEGVEEYTLSNGLNVLLFADSSKPTITVNVTYLVGSVNENYGETGMAHLLEHLMFQGTPGHKDIWRELTAHGADDLGTTGADRTNYYETFPSTESNLDWALDMEADRMVNSFISKKHLNSEMTVVRNEFEMHADSPQRVLTEHVMATAYLWHNYGKSPTGTLSDIENVPIERLQAFYRNWYQPDNAVLIVAGDIEPTNVLPLIAKKFGSIPRPSRVLQKTYTQEPVQEGERQVALRRAGDSQQVRTAYHIPAASHQDNAALEVLAYILGNPDSGRLYKGLVETGKAVLAYSDKDSMRESGLLAFGALVRKETSLEKTRDILLRITEGAAAGGFDAVEIERARTALLNETDLALRSPKQFCIRLSEAIASGDWRLFFIQRDNLKAVTAADVKRVAAQYLKPSNRTMGLFYPTDKADVSVIPPAPDMAALVKNYTGGAALAAGEAFDTSLENIDRRTRRSSLKDGLKLVLLPKKNRDSSVRVELLLDMGSEESLRGLGATPAMTGEMLMYGTLHHTRQQIIDEFDRLKTRAEISGGGVSLETNRDNLPAALRLAAEVLREPSFPANDFETLKQKNIASIEGSLKRTNSMVMNSFWRHMNNPYPPEDARYTPTPEEAIKRIKAANLAAVKAFHRDFYGASSGQLAIVGDFDPATVKALAEEVFGGWVSSKPYKRLERIYKAVEPARISLEVPDTANADMWLGLNFAMRDDNPDYPALLLANFMFGGGAMNSRLFVRMRQKDGLSYGAGSILKASPFDEYGEFIALASFNPQNLDKLEKAFREEFESVIADGFSADEVRETKTAWLQDRELDRSDDERLSSKLASNEHLGRTMAWDGVLEKKIKALTPAQIHEAFKRYIRPAAMSYVLAGDFAGAKVKNTGSAGQDEKTSAGL